MVKVVYLFMHHSMWIFLYMIEKAVFCLGVVHV